VVASRRLPSQTLRESANGDAQQTLQRSMTGMPHYTHACAFTNRSAAEEACFHRFCIGKEGGSCLQTQHSESVLSLKSPKKSPIDPTSVRSTPRRVC